MLTPESCGTPSTRRPAEAAGNGPSSCCSPPSRTVRTPVGGQEGIRRASAIRPKDCQLWALSPPTSPKLTHHMSPRSNEEAEVMHGSIRGMLGMSTTTGTPR